MDILLNTDLDITEIRNRFAETGRAQILDVLDANSAERIHTSFLEENIPWGITFRDGTRSPLLKPKDFDARTRDMSDNLRQKILQEAQYNFQFIYHCYPISDRVPQGKAAGVFVDKFMDFVNEKKTLLFMEKISGIKNLVQADAQATLYLKNDFLTQHNDDRTEMHRRIAYVFNFTKDWQPDWGGYLQFYYEDGNITEAFMPRFNCLNIFRVPANHSVSYVTPFANGLRLAITGWFRDG